MKLADHHAPRKISARTGSRFGVTKLVSGALVAAATPGTRRLFVRRQGS